MPCSMQAERETTRNGGGGSFAREERKNPVRVTDEAILLGRRSAVVTANTVSIR